MKLRLQPVSESRETHRFIMDLMTDQWEQLQNQRAWYRSSLKTKISTAALVRLAISEFLKASAKEIKKAEKGRFHAKLRSTESQPKKKHSARS